MDADADPLSITILLIILIIFDFMLSAFASAVDNGGLSHLDDEDDDRLKERISLLTGHIGSFMMVRETLISLFNILIGAFAVIGYGRLLVNAAGAVGGAAVACYCGACVVVFMLIMWFGVYLPWNLGERNPSGWTKRLIGFGAFVYGLCTPIVRFFEGLSVITALIFRIDIKERLDDVTEEEIISMVNEGHEQGVIRKSEADMIANIFELDDKNCEDIMTVRRNIIAIDGSVPLGEALDYMLDKNCSRFPVYDGDIDHIAGVIHIKDAFESSRGDRDLSKPISDIDGLVREIRFVPETQGINTLFKSMQKEKQHLVMVVDEYGQTSGIVAMEDILEEIVGNIEDEHDDEEKLIIERSDGSYLINGMADLDDVEDVLDIEFDKAIDVDTLNGFLITLIDKIPEDDERFEVDYGGWKFRILSVDNKTIRTVSAQRCADDVSDDDKD